MCSKQSEMASKAISINDLPNEILEEIYSHFGLEDLFLIIANVCEKWKKLVIDMILRKKLSYKCDYSYDIAHIKKVLRAAPALHSLIIVSRKDVASILECLNHIRGDLRKLILKRCWLGEDGTCFLANIVALYPDLEVLSVASCRPLTSAGYGLIPQLKKLSELNLSNCQGISGEAIRLIADGCPALKKISLGFVRLIDDDVIHVINRLGKQLTTLVLFGECLTDNSYLYFTNCARLQELDIIGCDKMTDRGLLEGIGSLHELTSLHLTGGRKLTAQALSTFLHRPSMTSIVSLNMLTFHNLDDEGLKGIAKRCIHLKELGVCGSLNITDAGIKTVISRCSQLRILNLFTLPHIRGE